MYVEYGDEPGGGGNRGNQLNLIGGTLNSLSATLTPMLVGAIIGESLADKGIDEVNIVLYIAMAVFALIYIIIRVTPMAEPQKVTDTVVYEHSPWAFRHLTLGVIAIFFYVGVEVGVPAALISYLHRRSLLVAHARWTYDRFVRRGKGQQPHDGYLRLHRCTRTHDSGDALRR